MSPILARWEIMPSAPGPFPIWGVEEWGVGHMIFSALSSRGGDRMREMFDKSSGSAYIERVDGRA